MGNLTIGVNAIGSSYAHAFVEIGSDNVTARPPPGQPAMPIPDTGNSRHAVTGRASWDSGAEAPGQQAGCRPAD